MPLLQAPLPEPQLPVGGLGEPHEPKAGWQPVLQKASLLPLLTMSTKEPTDKGNRGGYKSDKYVPVTKLAATVSWLADVPREPERQSLLLMTADVWEQS